MPPEIPKQYDPQAAQAKWFPFWEENGYFNADPDPEKPSHTIMIPLPNVTGALHMGHALNGTLQDLITRRKRMQGFVALWMPGTDHAGIATQAVVERRMLEEEGLTRHDIGREALVNRIWKWKEIYEQRILSQLKSIGASCDWRRTRFTLDEVCSKAVRRTFFKLFKDGLIYRGKRLVNWDTFLQTAVADDEVFEEEVQGHFWTFNYPVVDDAGNPTGTQISFSTTRPETMLGDTAVCVHPSDERYTDLVGRKVKLPLSERLIPIIADALLAKKDMGTGAVKVTPAHDPNDYACYLRNPEIGIINLLNPDGTFNENAGEYQGLDRFDVRAKVVEAMDAAGHFEEIEDRVIPIKHSDRSKTPVEPYLSDQWFVAMDELAQNAIDAVEDNRVKFYPGRYAKTYLDWLGEKRDWCISRQLWWGHRIPVWKLKLNADFWDSSLGQAGSTKNVTPTSVTIAQIKTVLWNDDIEDDSEVLSIIETSEEGVILCCTLESKVDEIFSKISEEINRRKSNKTMHSKYELAATYLDECVQDPDVLDTWFSSALWPQETLGWPDTDHNPPLNGEPDPSGNGENKVLPYFYPGSVLVTSRDIITLWVARMVLTGLYNMGDVPFEHVHVHPKILDGFGQTMSKSKGNGVDPVDLIGKYGTDAIRFTIASFAGETQDVRLPIGYECPHCEEYIPQTKEHQDAKPDEGDKPTIKCPACKKPFQYTSPNFDPDPGEPVGRMVSDRFEYGRNFCNKFWNATRFAMLNLEGYTPAPIDEAELRLEDRWILSRLSTVQHEVDEYLDRYQFDAATRTLRDFVWNEFCDWYLEMIKPRLRDDEQKPLAQGVLVGVLDTLLRLLAPFVPFIVEELWQRLGELAPKRGLFLPTPAEPAAIVAAWPQLPKKWQDHSLETRFGRLQETVIAVRNVRAVYNISPTTPMKLFMRCNDQVAADLNDVSAQFENLSRIVLEAAGASIERPPGSASFTLGDADGYLPLEGVIDREAELARQQKEREKLTKLIDNAGKKLANENFTSKAPEDVVQQARETLAGYEKQMESVNDIIAQLSE